MYYLSLAANKSKDFIQPAEGFVLFEETIFFLNILFWYLNVTQSCGTEKEMNK